MPYDQAEDPGAAKAAQVRDPRVDRMIARWTELDQARTQDKDEWRELELFFRQLRDYSQPQAEARQLTRTLTSASIIARSNFTSGLFGTLTNPANRWMGVRTLDPDLNNFGPMRDWLATVSRIILQSYQPSVSSFYPATIQLFGDLSTIGNACQYDEMNQAEGRILDVTLSLADVCFAVDGWGRVDEVVRQFSLTALQAVGMFGLEYMPERIAKAYDKHSTDKFVFYHHVQKNRDMQSGKLGPRGKRYSSVYGSEVGGAVLREGGYPEMPFQAPRWDVETGRQYGHGPARLALPAARAAELMKQANLRSGQFAADPTLLAPDREAMPLQGVIRPGEVVYGGMSVSGRRMIEALDMSRGTGLTLEMFEREIEDIRDAFHWGLMSVRGRTGMTDLEVQNRMEESLRQMAPHLGRVQEEHLAPKARRRFNMLWRAGQLPPPPEGFDGVGLEVQYLSAAAMAQKSAEGNAVNRLVNTLGPLAALDPRYAARLNPDAVAEQLAEAQGVPEQVLRTRQETDQMMQAAAERQQMQEAVAMAQQAGGAARDMAQAAAAGGQAQ